MPTSTTPLSSPVSSSSPAARLRSRLYLHRFFNEIGDGLIKVFVPILIYQRTGSLIACLVWLGGYYILQSIANLLLTRALVSRPIPWLWLRMLPVLVTQLLLVSGKTDIWLVAGLTLSTAFANVFYWIPLNSLMTASVESGKAGSTVGWIRASSVVGKIVAPILSGLLVAGYGIETSVLIASCAYGLSLLPLVGLVAPASPVRDRSTSEQNASATAIPLRTFLGAYTLAGVWDSAEVFWALHIYIFSATVVDAGLAVGLLQLGVAMANIITGKLTDRQHWWIPAVLGLVCYALLWGLRPFALGPWAIFSLSILAGFVRPGFEIPVFSGYLTATKQALDPERWLAYREVAIKVGGLVLVGGVALIGAAGTTPFLAAAAASLLFLHPLSRVAGRS